MSKFISAKTNFTSGEISKNLYGRGDLKIYENGARTLQNVIIHPTGGISRRRGLKYIDELNEEVRLIPFEFNSEQIYLVCIGHLNTKIYKDGVCITELETPWSKSHLKKLNYTQSADTLLIVHPDVEPKQLSRYNGEIWKVENWVFHNYNCPFHNFYERKVSLTIPMGGDVKITASQDIFTPDYVGTRLRAFSSEYDIRSYISPREVYVHLTRASGAYGSTSDWEEQAFSAARGWPSTVTFHQDRLVIGGSKSLPNRLWLSKSSDLFNFDLGKGLADNAIEFAILSDQVNAITSVVSSRHLLVFTTGAEWMVSGDPLTPTSIQLRRQTNVGSYAKYNICPKQVDGATVFVSQSGTQLREFLYTDVEQAYQAKDLTLMSNDIIKKPVDCTYHQNECVLYIVMEDGEISCLTTYRTEEVIAWSRLKTDGKFLSTAVIGDEIYFCVMRNNKYFIEKLDDEYYVDCGLKITSEVGKTLWDGLSHLEGCEVSVLADGFSLGKHTVSNGSINLLEEAREIVVGLPYEHIVEPLPFMLEGVKPFSPKAVRVISGLFRVLNTQGFCINMGKGFLQVPLKRLFKDEILDAPLSTYSGDIHLRAIGWIREMNKPLWSIKSDEPMTFTLLSSVLEVKTQD